MDHSTFVLLNRLVWFFLTVHFDTLGSGLSTCIRMTVHSGLRPCSDGVHFMLMSLAQSRAHLVLCRTVRFLLVSKMVVFCKFYVVSRTGSCMRLKKLYLVTSQATDSYSIQICVGHTRTCTRKVRHCTGYNFCTTYSYWGALLKGRPTVDPWL